MLDTLTTVLTCVAFGVTGAVVALNGIAPLTKTTKDDKVRDALVFVHDRLLAVILPFLASKVAEQKAADGTPKAGA